MRGNHISWVLLVLNNSFILNLYVCSTKVFICKKHLQPFCVSLPMTLVPFWWGHWDADWSLGDVQEMSGHSLSALLTHQPCSNETCCCCLHCTVHSVLNDPLNICLLLTFKWVSNSKLLDLTESASIIITHIISRQSQHFYSRPALRPHQYIASNVTVRGKP